MVSQSTVSDRPNRDDSAHVLENVGKIVTSAIIGAAALLTVGNTLRPNFSLGWSLLGALVVAGLEAWKIVRSPHK